MCQDNEKPVKDDTEIVSDSESNANQPEILSNETRSPHLLLRQES